VVCDAVPHHAAALAAPTQPTFSLRESLSGALSTLRKAAREVATAAADAKLGVNVDDFVDRFRCGGGWGGGGGRGRVASASTADASRVHFLLLCVMAVTVTHRPELMEATAAWVKGQRFADVAALAPDVYEGSLVRALRRTEELMAQVRAGVVFEGAL
jgi:hypothetical protein